MKLNLYQILERLPCTWHVLHCHDGDAFDISQVRLYSPGMTDTRKDALYIARSVDVKNQSGLIHLLVCGRPDETAGQAAFLSLTVLDTDESDLLWIFDQVQDILVMYQDWDTDIHAGIWDHAALQDTFDRCAGILGRPAGVFDLQQNLLMKSGLPDDTTEMDDLWNFTLAHGFTPYEGAQAAELNRIFTQTSKPFAYVSAENYPKAHRLIAPLFLNGVVFGCLGMHDSEKDLTEGERADFTLVQGYLNHAFSHTDEFHYGGQNTPWFAVQLLQGRTPDPTILQHNYLRYGVHMDQPFILWNFRGTQTMPGNGLLPIIRFLLHAELIFDYNGSILVVDTAAEEHSTAAFAGSLNNLLMQQHLTCGKSMVFPSPSQLYEAFLQTDIAILVGKQEQVNAYIDCYTAYFQRCICSQPEKDGLLYPGIRALVESDPEYGPELLRCLKSYILMGRNASRTAKELYIHRHTVLYRIEKIESSLGIHIDELGEKELALLYMSCLLAE